MENKRTFRRIGHKIIVKPDRVESIYGIFPFRKKTVIPLRSISSVEVTRATRTLIIRENSGGEHKVRMGFKSFKVRDAITDAMVTAA